MLSKMQTKHKACFHHIFGARESNNLSTHSNMKFSINKMNSLYLIFLFLLCSVCSAANGADQNENIRFEIQGFITKESLDQFDKAIIDNPGIREILLTNSMGAQGYGVEIVKEFKARIDQRKLRTFAKGYCFSTCAYIFLLGHERTMLSNPNGKSTMLLLHPVRRVYEEDINRIGLVQVYSTDELNKMISERSGGKITIELLDKMYGADDSTGGIFILREPNPLGKQILYLSSITKKIKATPISDLTPQDLGISIAE